MGSSRLPGKIMMPLAGKPVLRRVIERVGSAGFDEVVAALPDRDIDDPAAQLASVTGATVVRGDENDVLARYLLAARATRADVVMRVTADCPLIDPDVLDAMIGTFRENEFDLITNARVRTFPRGLDAELFTRDALETMATDAVAPAQREHVTPYLYANPSLFRIHDHVASVDRSQWRLTLDTAEDFDALTHVFELAANPDTLRLRDIAAMLEAHPALLAINAHVEQKEI